MFGLGQRPSNEISPALDTPAEPKKQDAYESMITAWMARNGVFITRIALGLVFLWFGALKFLPGMSEAEDVARRTLVTLTFGRVPPQVCLYLLAVCECAIGLGLLWGRFLKTTLILLFLQLLGTFLPLLFFPLETWKHFPYAPTLEGQYIMKNLVLVSAGIVIGSTVRGGKIISDPNAARVGVQAEKFYSRFRKRFTWGPKAATQKSRRCRASVLENLRGSKKMTVNLNPDPHAQRFKPQPTFNVTAIFDTLDDVLRTIRALQKHGFADEAVSVYLGNDGLAKLDLHGEAHGLLARLVRKLESLSAEAKANEDAEIALKQGGIFVAVETDGSENQKSTVECILKVGNAHSLRFFGRWTVQRL